MTSETEELRQKLAQALAALRSIQWGSCDDCGRKMYCPECGASNVVEDSFWGTSQNEGAPHLENCSIGKALGISP